MKLARFERDKRQALGVIAEDHVIDLGEPRNGSGVLSLIEVASDYANGLDGLVEQRSGARYALEDVRLLAPIARPPKFLAIGLNYADHIAESGVETPKSPVVFNKQTSCVNDPTGTVELPTVSEQLDYEGELGVVIGRRGRHVPRDRASEIIAGYLVINDVSVRDWQLAQPTWTMGKSFDTHGPIGPWLTTSDEVGDPLQLRLQTWVNGDLRQDSNTRHLVFGPSALIEHMSTVFTLEPGDIIATGTPGGVGFGMSPPRPLVAGDVVRVEIEGLGALENTVIAERGVTPRIG